MLFNRNVIIEKYSSLSELCNFSPDITFNKNGDNKIHNKIDEFFDILSEHLELKRPVWVSTFKNNVDYFFHDNNPELVTGSIDFDDWNFFCLYMEFALYSKTKKRPKYLFELERYGEMNRKEFEAFIKGEHLFFKLKNGK